MTSRAEIEPPGSVDRLATDAVPSGDLPAHRRRRRRLLPRFGLRSLFVIGLIVCLLFGWIGRGLYRVRQEDAAMESLLQAGATAWLIQESLVHPQVMADPDRVSFLERTGDKLARIVGWSGSPRIVTLTLDVPDREDPAADRALAALSFFPDVEELALDGAAFDDASLQELKRLPRLESLALTNARVTAEGLAAIPAPERLRTLRLDDPEARNVLVGVASLKELRSVTIGHATLSMEEMAAVAALPKLEALELAIVRPRVGDLLASLAFCESLRELYVSLEEASGSQRTKLPTLIIPPRVERVSISGLQSSELSLVVPGTDLRILMLKEWYEHEEAVVATFSADYPTCRVQVWGWSCSAEHIYVAGRRVGPGTSQPLTPARGNAELP